MKKSMLLVTVLMTVLGSPCLADQQDVSLSKDGSILVTAKERAIYVVDTKTMEVKKRIFSPAVVEAHCLDAKGAILAFRDDGNRFQLLELATGKYIKTVDRIAKAVCFAPRAQLAAVVETKQWSEATSLVVLSISTGKEMARVALPKGFVPARMAFDPEAKQVTMISRGRKGDEKKVPYDKQPKIKDPRKKKEYEQKHDGRVSSLLTVDIVTKKAGKVRETWLTVDGRHGNIMFYRGGKICFMQFEDLGAVLSEKDEITIVKGPISFNYGLGVRFADGAYAVGSMGDGAIVPAGKKPIKFEIVREQQLPGFPEYFYGFGFSSTGVVYGITSAMRLVEISLKGKILRIKPIL